MTNELFDVAVLGAGPAGASAALLLARKGHSVVLIERQKLPRTVPCSGWLNVRAAELLDEWGVKFKSLKDATFTDVTLFNADLTKSAKPKFEGPVGYLVDRSAFDNALTDAAVAAGATLMQPHEAGDLRLLESQVAIQLVGDKKVSSRLLVMAAGRGSPLIQRLGLTARTSETPICSAPVEAALPTKTKVASPRVAVILGLDGAASFAFCCVNAERASLCVNWFGDTTAAVSSLVKLCKIAADQGIVPVDLSSKAASVRPIMSPAAAALDMDTHVAKHALLVGDAGGFVSAASNEGVFPAMWSARIAADVIDRALQSPYSQDELMSFDSLWRMEIADHLRSPHTDLRFLLPLIFSNQPMADRMGAAFFFGENL